MQLQRQLSSHEVALAGARELTQVRRDEIDLIDSELTGLKKLEAKSLVSMARIGGLRRERTRAFGELVRMRAEATRLPEQIAEAKAKLVELDTQRLAEILTEIQNVEGEVLQYTERRAIVRDKISRLDVRAPASGFVHELSAHTEGGVIDAGETILSIVPENANLAIDARIGVDDRDSVNEGIAARIRFTAYNQRVTPEIPGTVRWVSPDRSSDEATGEVYFTARVELETAADEQRDLNSLSPGMRAEVFITTESRTVASYLFKPLADQFARAFRED